MSLEDVEQTMKALDALFDRYRVVHWRHLNEDYLQRLTAPCVSESDRVALLKEIRDLYYGSGFDSLEDLLISEDNKHRVTYEGREKANAELEEIRRKLNGVLDDVLAVGRQQ